MGAYELPHSAFRLKERLWHEVGFVVQGDGQKHPDERNLWALQKWLEAHRLIRR